MKQTLPIITTLLLFGGCVQTINHVPARTQSIAFDFSPHTEQGFMITPEGYGGDYEAVGMINLILWPEARRIKRDANLSGVSMGNAVIQGNWAVTRLSTEDLVKAAFEEAKAMGADAIIRFMVTPTTESPTFDLTLTGFSVSGFAIRRK